jgi:cyclopropane-fatty-acyl-phospholipid synthase
VSIGAFEHFGRDRYDDFFKKAYAILPQDGVMMLHTIIKPTDEEFAASGLPLTMKVLRFSKFIMDEIFPGGDLPKPTTVEEHAASCTTHGRSTCGRRRSRRTRTRPSRFSPKRSTTGT